MPSKNAKCMSPSTREPAKTRVPHAAATAPTCNATSASTAQLETSAIFGSFQSASPWIHLGRAIVTTLGNDSLAGDWVGDALAKRLTYQADCGFAADTSNHM